MSWLAEKYIGLVSAKLEKFEKKQEGLYNFRCPFCGDSAKNKYKARGYLYNSKGNYRFHCHNCGLDISFSKFLKSIDSVLAKEYSFESFRGSKPRTQAGPVHVKETETYTEKRLLDKLLPRLDSLAPDHPAVIFLEKRKIPTWAYQHLYFIENVKDIHQLSPRYKDRITSDEPRIVIPAFTRDGVLTGVTCRAILDDSAIRYIAVTVSQTKPTIFGLDRIDLNKRIYVVEGPFDSFFLDNCIAVGTSSLVAKAQAYIDKSRDVLIFDNQPRNKEIVTQVKQALMDGYNVVVWPSRLEEKDLNDMVLAGHDVTKLVDENVKSGVTGLPAWTQWKKI